MQKIIKVKVREMDQSIRSVAESLCFVYTLTEKTAISLSRCSPNQN